MIQVFVEVSGETKRAEISETTHSRLRIRVFMSGKPIHFFLRAVVQEYGNLNESNCQKYLDEHKNFS